MNIDLENIKHFPTLPGTAFEVMRLALDPDVSIPRMSEVILRDVALSTRILKTVNSPYYPLARSVTNISDALVLLGLQTVKNITLSLSVMDSFRQHLDLDTYNFLQARALNMAVATQAIAEDSRLIPSEDAFLTGLLQELGLFLLAYLAPKEFARCVHEAGKRGLDVTITVQELLRIDFAELGLKLAEKWSLAAPFRDSIHYQLSPENARKSNIPEERYRYVIVAYLGRLAAEIYIGWRKILHIQRFKDGYHRYLGKAEHEAEEMLHKLGAMISNAAASFQASVPPPRSYSLILEEANAELGRINLQYEQMYHELIAKAAELDVANKELNKLTEELNRKNRILAELASKDGLTDLFNHRSFQEFIKQQCHQSLRYGRPLSVLLLDIDHFKNLNDTYGHQFGDLILKELAGILRRAVRKADIIARYGGEEFAVILPDTGAEGAASAAEKIRHAVQQHSIPSPGNTPVGFTVSIGVAQLSAHMSDAGELIGAADSSLYKAKRTGRNRVCVLE